MSKERILAVERILSKRPKNAKEILSCLYCRYGIKAERKAIYDNVAVLTKYINIQTSKQGYYIED